MDVGSTVLEAERAGGAGLGLLADGADGGADESLGATAGCAFVAAAAGASGAGASDDTVTDGNWIAGCWTGVEMVSLAGVGALL